MLQKNLYHTRKIKTSKDWGNKLASNKFSCDISRIFIRDTPREREKERGEEGEKGRGEKLVRTATDIEIICGLAAFLIIAARSKQKTLATNLKWKWILSINSICMGERERRLKKKITTKTVFNQFQLHTTETATNDFFEIGLAFGLTKIFCHCRR